MNISISCSVYGELHDAIKRDQLLAELVQFSWMRIEWPSREFDALMQIWRGKGHVSAILEFSAPPELASECRLFEVYGPDGTAYALSDADGRYFSSQEKSGPLLPDSDCAQQYYPPVRYFPEIKLSKPRIKPRCISSLEAPWPAYFIGTEDAEVWRSEGFSGLRFGPVYSHRAQVVHQNASLIVPENVMGRMVAGSNVIKQHFMHAGVEYSYPLATGFMVYMPEQLAGAKDFNFTCEPASTYGYPRIVVSKRFVDLYHLRGMKGWKLRPILEFGSRFHKEFLETFEVFMADWRSGHPDNRIVG